MNGYDVDKRIIFATLAIGLEHIEHSLMLIQSVMKFTTSDVYIVTDNISSYENHIKYFTDRLKIIDITKTKNYTSHINEIFNYHLKSIAIQLVSLETNASIVYVDADTFLFGWDKSLSRYITGIENSLLCRFREKVSDNTSLARFIPQKALSHGVDYKNIHTHLAVETIMVITRGESTTKFLNEWVRISEYSIEHKIDPFIEAFELALALHNTQMPCVFVTNKTPFADNFRTIHNGKLISTNII